MPLILISPAKTMNFSGERKAPIAPATLPARQRTAASLAARLAKVAPKRLEAVLGGVSVALACENAARFKAFDPAGVAKAPEKGRFEYAALAYDGPAFRGLEAETLPPDAAAYLQSNVRVLSGMYGAVRPFDLIQPYRLCMGLKPPLDGVAAGGGGEARDLYDLWARCGLTRDLAAETLGGAEIGKGKGKAGGGAPPLVVNVASQEYSKAVARDELPSGTVWVDCVFKDSGRVLSFFAKRARGLMARWCALHRVQSAEQLKGFNLEGYKFVPSESTPTQLVFGRAKPPPASASKKPAKAAAAAAAKAETPEQRKRGAARKVSAGAAASKTSVRTPKRRRAAGAR